jgi:hypothetical protein
MNNWLAMLLPIGQRLSFIQFVPDVFFDFIQPRDAIDGMLGSAKLCNRLLAVLPIAEQLLSLLV